MAKAVQVKRGHIIRWNGNLWKVVETQQVFFGKRGAYIQMKLENVTDGHIETNRFSSSEEVERLFLEQRAMEYLYQDGLSYVFMEPKSGEQIQIGEKVLKDALPYMAFNTQVDVQFVDGEAVSVELPSSVVLEVRETDPAVRGDTATTVTKPAEVETGLTVKVPGHIKQGDKIRVDTRTGGFLGRA